MDKLFKPPANYSMRNLDRDFFRKQILISAATIFDSKHVSPLVKELRKKDNLFPFRKSVISDPSVPGCKCILLSPDIKATHPETWSSIVTDMVEKKLGSLKPYTVELNYDDWGMHEILAATIPLGDQDELPAGFTQMGHVAHLNLREAYLPYKHLIGQVLLSKRANLRTVINKIDDVGLDSVYRTFKYEILAGPDDRNVTVSENDCTFKFDFARVYWNSRLESEHRRLISKFKEGQAVCDVMAGVGPFAVPAGKRNVFVWANDLNPDSYTALKKAIKANKVFNVVRPFSMDGREFIRSSAVDLLARRRLVTIPHELTTRPRNSSNVKGHNKKDVPGRDLMEPSVFSHYIMNLPASAAEFLDAFRGLYHSRRLEFNLKKPLPMLHVYCFSPKRERIEDQDKDVCDLISTHLGAVIKPSDPEVEVHEVRLVSPQKKMFCVSFMLPPEVAFAEP